MIDPCGLRKRFCNCASSIHDDRFRSEKLSRQCGNVIVNGTTFYATRIHKNLRCLTESFGRRFGQERIVTYTRVKDMKLTTVYPTMQPASAFSGGAISSASPATIFIGLLIAIRVFSEKPRTERPGARMSAVLNRESE